MQGNYGVFLEDGNPVGFCGEWDDEKGVVVTDFWTMKKDVRDFDLELFEKVGNEDVLKASLNVHMECTHRVIPGMWSTGVIELRRVESRG